MKFLKGIIIGVLLGIIVYFLRTYLKGNSCHISNRIDGKHVLITGANCGLGLETARKLASLGGIIHIACRDSSKCQSARNELLRRTNVDEGRIIAHTVDLASIASIIKFTQSFKQTIGQLDILINNAGVFLHAYQETEDGFEMHIGVNYLGHFLLTNQLLDVIKRGQSPRIIIVSSSIHEFGSIDIEDLSLRGEKYGLFKAYAQSKLANVLHARALSLRLRDSGVAVVSLHPGVVHTEIQREFPGWVQEAYRLLTYVFLKNVEDGSQTHICCALDPDLLQHTGEYFNNCYPESSRNKQVYNDSLSEWLWYHSEQLINTKRSGV